MRKVNKPSAKTKKTKMNTQGMKVHKGSKVREMGPQSGPFRNDRTKHVKRKPFKSEK